MAFLILCFIVSLLLTLMIIRSAGRHAALSADHDLSGPQKFHARAVPRIGGVGVFIAILAGAALALALRPDQGVLLWLLIAAALPAFGSGLAEDLTKSVSPKRRLVFTALSAGLGIWLLEATIVKAAIPGIDYLLGFTPFAIFLTVFVVTGVANAVNIIDGFNGLAAMCVLIMLLAITYVALQVGDTFIMTASLITAGAVLGFFVWNFPAGLIFLGDGGAYLLGFLLAELSVLLLHRNPQVSPMFALLSCAYPIFETIFSIYRKKFLRGMSPGVPDGVHLHMLVYKRLMRWAVGSREAKELTSRNSLTSPYLWILCLSTVIPSVLWWHSTPILASFLVAFMALYVFLYWSIVRFKSPKWMVIRR
jgi:UDP-N-acetylmuramyl pentapeptide phosphotransferase/UDP-N-acetylglucosamine-1-phosphate transferase